ncbi:potassium/proton antiporter [Cerasibacillus terrae]|uniref:Potassium/proton antiporter n=1 Tax=Cerasibacillus terrae TaxID=2498845 RepID=A0A5C8NQ87_9BACI|nr:potassium/proton antiporter [Cerasibacillus terrae]TXL62553.1 potassium/proton antiporter [Cerasibacillus terrae]
MLQELTQSNNIVLLFSLLLIISVLVTKFSSRMGVPTLVLFILVGMVAGSDGLDIIYFDNAKLAQLIGVFALVIILFEGGLQTEWKNIKPIIKTSAILATLGVLITTTVVAVAAKYILGYSWLEGFLIGSIIGSTDAAAVFSVLKEKNIKMKIKSTLEAESGSNDPMAMFLTISVIQLIIGEQDNIWSLIGNFFWQMGIGLILGYVIGKIGEKAINHINLNTSGLYPLFAISFSFLTYGITSLFDASGLLAVYIAGIVIGNSDELTYRYSIFSFNEGFSWMAQIVMFVILGLFVFPSNLFTFDNITKGLFISVILMFIARPVAVFTNLIKSKYSLKEKLFLSWAGLRGAVPVVLAIFPMLAGLENSQAIFDIVFFVVLTSTLIQGSTITYMAEKLGVDDPQATKPVHSLELISIGKTNVEMVEYHVTKRNKIIGKNLEEIPLTDNTLVNAIIREEDIITPGGQTVIKNNDILYILVPKKKKRELIQILERNMEEKQSEIESKQQTETDKKASKKKGESQ